MPTQAEIAAELQRLKLAADTTADGTPDGLGETAAALFDYFESNFDAIIAALEAAERARWTDDKITAGAKWLAENVIQYLWAGTAAGSAKEKGFDPWVAGARNARQEDFRDAVRGMLKAMEESDGNTG